MIAAQAPRREPAECAIEIDRAPLPTTLIKALAEVTVTMSRSQATTGVLRFDTHRDERGEWIVQDSGHLAPWKPIAIPAHFGSHSEEVMRGFIKQIDVDYPASMGAASVRVAVQDETLALDREHIRRVWAATGSDGGTNGGSDGGTVSDGQIVRELVSQTFVDVVADPGTSHTSLCQDATAAVFLRQRARALGFELYARAGVLYFEQTALDGEPQPAIMVYAGSESNCAGLSIHYNGHMPDGVRVDRAAEVGHENTSSTFRSRLALLGSQSAESQKSSLKPFEWRMARPYGAGQAQVEAAAQATADRNAWKLIAEGELDGTRYGHVLLTHRTVEVDGVGSTFGGRYYVDEVTHTFSPAGYSQQFRLLRNATGQS